MFTLIILWTLVLFLPIACLGLVEGSFEGRELRQMGIKIHQAH